MSGQIFPQDGDTLDETNLSRLLALSHHSDYVERGIALTADFQANTFEHTFGVAFIRNDSHETREVRVAPESGIALPVTSGVNYIYLVADFTDTTNSAVNVDAVDTDTAPNSTSLKIGEIDTSADTVTEINRSLPIDTENIDASLLGGNPPDYYAPINSPQFTGTPGVYGNGSTFEVGGSGNGGPHNFRFGNDSGDDQGFFGFRTGPEEFRFENDNTGDVVMSIPIDGTTKPSVFGEPIKTGEGSADVFVGPDPPSNPDDGDVWIDTS